MMHAAPPWPLLSQEEIGQEHLLTLPTESLLQLHAQHRRLQEAAPPESEAGKPHACVDCCMGHAWQVCMSRHVACTQGLLHGACLAGVHVQACGMHSGPAAWGM